MNLEESQKNKTGVFEWTDKTKIRPSQKLVFNYTGGLKIKFKENVQKTFSKNGYFLAGPFLQEKDGVAHLMINDRQYYIYKIYVLAKEVVIQHKPVMNGTDITLRIPIISTNSQNKNYTSIDRLLSNSPLVSFQLNTLLKNGSLAALYSGGTVIYLESGIKLQTIISEKNIVYPYEEIGVSLFKPDYVLVPIHLGDNSSFSGKAEEKLSNSLFDDLQEGLQDDMIDMDDDMECTPFDMGADNVQFMQVPIADDSLAIQSNKNTMFGILYLFYMGVIVMALCFLAPLIVTSVLSTLNNKDNNDVMTNFKSMFVLFFLCLFIGSIFVTLDGSERHNVEESKAGLIIFFIAFSCSAIFVIYAINSSPLGNSKWDLGNLMEFLFECLPFKKFKMIFTFFAIFFVVFCLVISIDEKYFKGKFSLTPNVIVWGIFFSFAVGIFAASMTNRVNLNQPLGNKPNLL